MQGQTECLPDAYEVKNAWEYLYKTDTLKTLCHPVGEDIDDLLLGAHRGYGSLVPAFCDAYIRERNTNVVAVHVAKGATVIADWAAESKRYACARRKILAAIHKTKTIESTEKIYYIWLQGESDAISGTERSADLAALLRYKEALKKDVGIHAFGIIRVGYFTQQAEKDQAIMAAQEDAVEWEKDIIMLTRITARLSRDERFLNPYESGHYNNNGMELLGRVAGQALGSYALIK